MLNRIMEEEVSTFQSVVEAEQQNGGPQRNDPCQKMKILPAVQTRNRIWINPSRDERSINTTHRRMC